MFAIFVPCACDVLYHFGIIFISLLSNSGCRVADSVLLTVLRSMPNHGDNRSSGIAVFLSVCPCFIAFLEFRKRSGGIGDGTLKLLPGAAAGWTWQQTVKTAGIACLETRQNTARQAQLHNKTKSTSKMPMSCVWKHRQGRVADSVLLTVLPRQNHGHSRSSGTENVAVGLGMAL